MVFCFVLFFALELPEVTWEPNRVAIGCSVRCFFFRFCSFSSCRQSLLQSQSATKLESHFFVFIYLGFFCCFVVTAAGNKADESC